MELRRLAVIPKAGDHIVRQAVRLAKGRNVQQHHQRGASSMYSDLESGNIPAKTRTCRSVCRPNAPQHIHLPGTGALAAGLDILHAAAPPR